MVMIAVVTTASTRTPGTPLQLKAGQAVEFFSEAETAAWRSSFC